MWNSSADMMDEHLGAEKVSRGVSAMQKLEKIEGQQKGFLAGFFYRPILI